MTLLAGCLCCTTSSPALWWSARCNAGQVMWVKQNMGCLACHGGAGLACDCQGLCCDGIANFATLQASPSSCLLPGRRCCTAGLDPSTACLPAMHDMAASVPDVCTLPAGVQQQDWDGQPGRVPHLPGLCQAARRQGWPHRPREVLPAVHRRSLQVGAQDPASKL